MGGDDDDKLPLLSEHEEIERKGKSRKVSGRMCCYITLGVMFVLVLLMKGAIRPIADYAIQQSRIELKSMWLTQPKETSVQITTDLAISPGSSVHAALSAFNATIWYHSAPFAEFSAPKMELHSKQTVHIRNTTLYIRNQTAWNQFSMDMVRSDHLQWTLKGHVDIKTSFAFFSIQISQVPVMKVMKLSGMGGLQKMNIIKMDMSNSTEQQVKAQAMACVFNPSVMKFDPVGDLCLYADYPKYHARVSILRGLASLPIVHFEPSAKECVQVGRYGYNLLRLTGTIIPVNQSIATEPLISRYVTGKDVELRATACQPIASSIPLYNEAMRQLNVTTVLHGSREPLIRTLYLDSIRLNPQKGDEANRQVKMDLNTRVLALSPLGTRSTLRVENISMNVTMLAALHEHDTGVWERKFLTPLGHLYAKNVDVLDGQLVDLKNISIGVNDARFELVKDGKPFGRFVSRSIRSKRITLYIRGTSNVVAFGALGRLNLRNLPLDVSIQLNGMDGLSNVSISDFKLTKDTLHGEELRVGTNIFNPSLFSVPLTDVSLQMLLPISDAKTEQIGMLHSDEINLVSGDNSEVLVGELLPKRSVVDPSVVSEATNQFFSDFLQNKNSHIGVKIAEIKTQADWLRDAVTGIQFSTMVNGVGKNFKLMTDLKMLEMQVVFQSDGMFIRSNLESQVHLPSCIEIPRNITHLTGLRVSIATKMNETIGELSTGPESCVYNSTTGHFRLDMKQLYRLKSTMTMKQTLADFIKQLVLQDNSIEMRLQTNNDNQGVSPLVDTHMGTLAFNHVPIHSSFSIQAMDSFTKVPIKILSLDIASGQSIGLNLNLTIALFNPSCVTATMGRLKLYLEYEKETLGQANIDRFYSKCCNSTTALNVTMALRPKGSQSKVMERFLSNFMSGFYSHGKPQRVRMYGTKDSSRYEVLRPALSGLSIWTTLPPFAALFPETPTLLLSASMYRPSFLHLTQIHTTLALSNPFSAGIQIVGANFTMVPCKTAGKTACQEYFTSPLAGFSPSPFHVIDLPPHTSECYSCCQGSDCENLPLCPNASKGTCMAATVLNFFSAEAISALFATASSTGLFIHVTGTLTVEIDGYPTTLDYQQRDLRVKLHS